MEKVLQHRDQTVPDAEVLGRKKIKVCNVKKFFSNLFLPERTLANYNLWSHSECVPG